MKKIFKPKYTTAICFLILIFGFYFFSIRPVARGGRSFFREFLQNGTVDFSIIETTYQADLPANHFFITLNGGFQRLIGARNVNERYLLENRQLTYVIEEYDMNGIAGNTVAFRDALAQLEIPMVYINTPFKIDAQDPQLPIGVSDYSNENADRFLSLLRGNNVPVLDLRECIEEDQLDHYSLFYPTDHHWTAEAGFWAAGRIIRFLTEQDESFHTDSRITDLQNYTQTVHHDMFLGSSGRRTGPLYSGLDDMTVISPAFQTSLTFHAPEKDIFRQGTYQDTILFPEYLEGMDYFDTSRYLVYCGNTTDNRILIQNNAAQEELDIRPAAKKILLIKDSFSSMVIPYLALGYEGLSVIDLRGDISDLMSDIEKYQPDLVMVMYNPGAYKNTNWDMFDFLK